MVRKIEFSQHEDIIEQVALRYEDWRDRYGAPRSQTAIRHMCRDVLSPILDKLSYWDDNEESAQGVLDSIYETIKERIKP